MNEIDEKLKDFKKINIKDTAILIILILIFSTVIYFISPKKINQETTTNNLEINKNKEINKQQLVSQKNTENKIVTQTNDAIGIITYIIILLGAYSLLFAMSPKTAIFIKKAPGVGFRKTKRIISKKIMKIRNNLKF